MQELLQLQLVKALALAGLQRTEEAGMLARELAGELCPCVSHAALHSPAPRLGDVAWLRYAY